MNSEKKYTRAPWNVIDEGRSTIQIMTGSYNSKIDAWIGDEICEIKKFSEDNIYIQETDANAKLIASAPQLLEALIVCYTSLKTYGSHPIIDAQVLHTITLATK